MKNLKELINFYKELYSESKLEVYLETMNQLERLDEIEQVINEGGSFDYIYFDIKEILRQDKTK